MSVGTPGIGVAVGVLGFGLEVGIGEAGGTPAHVASFSAILEHFGPD